jgi:DNA-binding NarL/FixJ family response regulator
MNPPEPQAPWVLIADDHPLYCDALRAVVSQALPGSEIRDSQSQDDVLRAMRGHDFDLVLLDLNLPGASGLSCLHALRKLAPTTPIVVVSAIGDPRVMQETVVAGASAFIPKSAPSKVLIHALQVIIAGGTYLPTEVVAALRQTDSPASNGELTGRQRRVLELLATGLSNKGIAREMKISEITVKAHVSAILRKLGVTNRVQAGIEARKLLNVSH